MEQDQTLKFDKTGFDNEKYIRLQQKAIEERLEKFQAGRMYLEVGGKLLSDAHAARVLPGFDPLAKIEVLGRFIERADFIFAINAEDLLNDRQLNSDRETYVEEVLETLLTLRNKLDTRPMIAFNFYKESEQTDNFLQELQRAGFAVYRRFRIPGYPEQTNHVLSKKGFGRDEYIPVSKKLVIVTGAASGSGKLSTCLGQLYFDSLEGISAGYAKYELFPIWNLPLSHPVNLAYEAATADLGDYNIIDQYHLDYYSQTAVNYNRDVESFEILMKLAQKMIDGENPIRNYHSPTDMGINMALLAITDQQVVINAAREEIVRRRQWYQDMLEMGVGKKEWVEKCRQLEKEAAKYHSD